jgi:hypothetical protein
LFLISILTVPVGQMLKGDAAVGPARGKAFAFWFDQILVVG